MPRDHQRTTSKTAWLQLAKTAIEEGMSKRQARKQSNVPFTTLRDQLKNENMNNPALGHQLVFTPQQET